MYVMEVACWSCACELSVSSFSCLPCVSAFSSFYWDRVCHLWPFDTYFNRHFILLLHSTAQSRRTAAATAAEATNWNCSQTSSVFLLGTNANCQIAQSKDWYETHSTMSVELCAVVWFACTYCVDCVPSFTDFCAAAPGLVSTHRIYTQLRLILFMSPSRQQHVQKSVT